MLNKIGTLLYKNPWDYEVWAVIMRDISSQRISVEIYTVSSSGEISDLMTLKRSDLYTNKNCLNFLMNLDGEFSRDDITQIKNKIMEVLNNKNCDTSKERATFEEVCQRLSEYITNLAEDLKDNPDANIFIKDKAGYLNGDALTDFCKLNNDLGFKKLEILKRLKIFGLMEPGKKRPYDMCVSINGKKRHFYKILLGNTKKDEIADEEIVL